MRASQAHKTARRQWKARFSIGFKTGTGFGRRISTTSEALSDRHPAISGFPLDAKRGIEDVSGLGDNTRKFNGASSNTVVILLFPISPDLATGRDELNIGYGFWRVFAANLEGPAIGIDAKYDDISDSIVFHSIGT